MNVRQLIEKLVALPEDKQELPVIVYDGGDPPDLCEVVRVEVCPHQTWFDEEYAPRKDAAIAIK